MGPDGGSPSVLGRRLTLRTGVLELVQAMPTVLERWPDARLVIAGEGHQRATIAEYIRRSGLEGSNRAPGTPRRP